MNNKNISNSSNQPMQPSSAEESTQDLARAVFRLGTFENADCQNLDRVSVFWVSCGFYFTENHVKCFSCGRFHNNWKDEYNPEDPDLHHPGCKLTGNISIGSYDRDQNNSSENLENSLHDSTNRNLGQLALNSGFEADEIKECMKRKMKKDGCCFSSSEELIAALEEQRKKRIKELEDKRTCQICCDRIRDVVFCPCGHAICCWLCADCIFKSSNKKCPVCRSSIEKGIRFYRD